MPRPPRRDWEGAWHHVVNRGARREEIFRVNEHCDRFLTCLGETRNRYGIEIHAYALMPNHYHLLVRSARGNLSGAMRYLGGSYTRSVNDLHGWDGPIFKGRFRNQVLEHADAVHGVFAYVHLNPLRAKLIPRVDEENAWTSYRAYVGLELPFEWLHRDTLLAELGGSKGVWEYVRSVWNGSRPWPENFRLDDGWFLPPPMETKVGAVTDGPPTPLLDPDEVLAEVLRVTGASQEVLKRAQRGAKANPARRLAAWALARFTKLRQRQIGGILDMSESQTSHLLSRLRRHLPPPLDEWGDELELTLNPPD